MMPAEDPKKFLTEHLVVGHPEEEKNDDKDRTIINSKEQIEFYFYYTKLGEATGIQFFKDMARLDERLMMSFKGKRAEEIVEALTGIEAVEVKKSGAKELAEELKKKEPHGH